MALRAAWLFDGTGSALIPDPVVLIKGHTILDVGSGVAIPDGVRMTDLGGATLLPGLVDTHVHLAFDTSADVVGHLARQADDEVVDAMAAAARTALRGGVTTVRDLGDRGYLSLGLRGRADLPHILAAGPPITTPDGHCHFLGGATAPTATGVRAAVRERAERGVDVIKIMASGGNLTPGSRQEASQFPAGVLRAAVDEAHRLGLPVTAHAHATSAIADSVAAGVDGLEHASFWAADGIDSPAELVRYSPAILVQLGMSPAQALRVITSGAAAVCGVGNRKGRIAAGYDADILAVGGDPLSELDALHRIRAVYARGAAVRGPEF